MRPLSGLHQRSAHHTATSALTMKHDNLIPEQTAEP